jgi:hypothetical protein
MDPPPGVFIDNPSASHVIYATTSNINRSTSSRFQDIPYFDNLDKCCHFMVTLLTTLVHLPPIMLMDKFIRYVYDSGCDAEFYFRQPCQFAEYNNHRFWHFPVSHAPGPSVRDADHRSCVYRWSHATSPAGMVGALTTMKMMKSEDDIDYPTYGFFCQATSETTEQAMMDIVLKAWYHTSK